MPARHAMKVVLASEEVSFPLMGGALTCWELERPEHHPWSEQGPQVPSVSSATLPCRWAQGWDDAAALWALLWQTSLPGGFALSSLEVCEHQGTQGEVEQGQCVPGGLREVPGDGFHGSVKFGCPGLACGAEQGESRGTSGPTFLLCSAAP